MARFVASENVRLSIDLDADETGYTPIGAVTVSVDDGDAIATTVDGSNYVADVGRLSLGIHTVQWSDTTGAITDGLIEVVGSHLCTVADIRAGDAEFTNPNRFPASKLRAAREYVADEFDAITGRSFVRRRADVWTVTDKGGFFVTSFRDNPVIVSATVNGSPADPDTFDIDDTGILTGPGLETDGDSVTLTIEYGFTRLPEDVRRAAAIRVRSIVSQTNNGIPDRATQVIAPDGGQMTLAVAGRAGFETGVPEVDAVLGRYVWKVYRDTLGML